MKTQLTRLLNAELPARWFPFAELGLIVLFAIIPLFFNYPYRLNIFLSWEGAYRLSEGQIPFRDFGLPLGFGYWLVPALFFKVFGPYLITLVKAQAFLNLLSGLAFRSILGSFALNRPARLLSLLVFSLSYTFFNFWPWYNHTVIVYALIGFAFLFKAILPETIADWYKKGYLSGAAFFLFLSFFTKQDGGGLALLIALVLLLVVVIYEKRLTSLLVFLIAYGAVAALFILPFLPFEFSYWFNYGQPPHYSRLSLLDLIETIVGGSAWEKFYLMAVLIIAARQVAEQGEAFLANRQKVLFFLFTSGILVMALIFQVTSYVPADNNIFFHSFAIAYLLGNLPAEGLLRKTAALALATLLVLFWWSGTYWKYAERILQRLAPDLLTRKTEVVSKNTFISGDAEADSNTDMAEWVYSDLPVFKGIYMPKATVEGINRIKAMPGIWQQPSPKVLNMTELTPLAWQLPFEIPKGQPLWFHKGVAFFDREVAVFCERIGHLHYDLVLFEDIPALNNFYPDQVLECLRLHYHLADTFPAPRRQGGKGTIYVFVRPKGLD